MRSCRVTLLTLYICVGQEPLQSLTNIKTADLSLNTYSSFSLKILSCTPCTKMHPSTSLFVTAVTLGLSSVTNAVCTGNTIAVGTATTSSTGTTQWNIYDTSCNLLNTYSQDSSVSICDSSVFYCTFGTTLIDQYDDPKTGWAYSCTTDTTVEACGTDTIISCVSFFPHPPLPRARRRHIREAKGREIKGIKASPIPSTNSNESSRAFRFGAKYPTPTLRNLRLDLERICLFCMNRMGLLRGQGAMKMGSPTSNG